MININLSEDILFYAFRYVLGRSTYAVHDVIDEINKNINILSINILTLIKKEILEAPTLGMDIDREAWMNLYKKLDQKINNKKLDQKINKL